MLAYLIKPDAHRPPDVMRTHAAFVCVCAHMYLAWVLCGVVHACACACASGFVLILALSILADRLDLGLSRPDLGPLDLGHLDIGRLVIARKKAELQKRTLAPRHLVTSSAVSVLHLSCLVAAPSN